MAKQYTKEELWKLYEKLPQELKEAVFSQETADAIFNACERNEVEDVPKVAYSTGLVLMGALLPANFEKTIQQDLGLEESTAKNVANEINRFVFYPVRPALEQLHNMKVGKAEFGGVGLKEKQATPVAEEKPAESVAESPKKADTYREPVEQ